MSRMISRARKFGLTGAIAAAAVVASASGAQAATKTLTYTGPVPLIDQQPFTATTAGFTPLTIKVGKPTGFLPVKTQISAGGDFSTLLQLVAAGSVEGVATATYRVSGPGFSLSVNVAQTIARTSKASFANPVVLKAAGTTPSITFPVKGKYTVTQTALNLNLLVRDVTGDPISELSAASSVPDSDGDPNTFDVPLSLSPATQNAQFPAITVIR